MPSGAESNLLRRYVLVVRRRRYSRNDAHFTLQSAFYMIQLFIRGPVTASIAVCGKEKHVGGSASLPTETNLNADNSNYSAPVALAA